MMNGAAKATIWVAVITAAGGVITAIGVALVNRPTDDRTGGDRASTPTQTRASVGSADAPGPSPSQISKSVVPTQLNITLDSVRPRGDHQRISSKDGLVAAGTVKNLPPGYSIWLMDRDEAAYAIAEAARVSGERWTAESYPLGDPKVAVPYDLTVVVVKADAACTRVLRQRVRREQYQMPDLMTGCTEAGAQDIQVLEK